MSIAPRRRLLIIDEVCISADGIRRVSVERLHVCPCNSRSQCTSCEATRTGRATYNVVLHLCDNVTIGVAVRGYVPQSAAVAEAVGVTPQASAELARLIDKFTRVLLLRRVRELIEDGIDINCEMLEQYIVEKYLETAALASGSIQ